MAAISTSWRGFLWTEWMKRCVGMSDHFFYIYTSKFVICDLINIHHIHLQGDRKLNPGSTPSPAARGIKLIQLLIMEMSLDGEDFTTHLTWIKRTLWTGGTINLQLSAVIDAWELMIDDWWKVKGMQICEMKSKNVPSFGPNNCGIIVISK